MKENKPDLRLTPKMVAEAAPQQDLQVAGLFDLSSASINLVPNLTRLLREQGLNTARAFLGRRIPAGVNPKLLKLGVDQICGPDTLAGGIPITMQDICQ